MAINSFVQPDENGVTRLPRIPRGQQPQYMGMPAPAPVQFNPGAFAPMIAPFAGAFNQASQAEATGIGDLRLARMLDSMFKQRQIAQADAVLPYAGEAANLQNRNTASEINTRDQSLPLLLQQLQAQTGLQTAQAGAVPQEALARLMSAMGVQQGAQNDSLSQLLQALSMGGPLSTAQGPDQSGLEVLRQRMGIPAPQPAAPAAAQPQTQSGSGFEAFLNTLVPSAAATGGWAAGPMVAKGIGLAGPYGKAASVLLSLLAGYAGQKAMDTGSPEGLATAQEHPWASLVGGLLPVGVGMGMRKPAATAAQPKKAAPVSGASLPQPAQRPLPQQASPFAQPPTTVDPGVLKTQTVPWNDQQKLQLLKQLLNLQ